MSKCAVKRGIITLRDCGNEASDTCTVCARPMCQEHTRVRGAELLCVECFARQAEEQTAGQATRGTKTQGASRQTRESDWEDESWPYVYRHHYYTSYHYQPFYYGSYYDSYYDSYDMRSFDRGSADALDDDEAAAGGFYDS
jgi:hypothetical protein